MNFKKWIKIKEAEAIYDGKNHPDFQWWGCPEKYVRKKRKRTKLKKK